VIDEDVGAPTAGAGIRSREVRQDLRQLTEPQLGRSTTAARVLRQADRGSGFGRHPRI
jgi:hypothetical protein